MDDIAGFLLLLVFVLIVAVTLYSIFMYTPTRLAPPLGLTITTPVAVQVVPINVGDALELGPLQNVRVGTVSISRPPPVGRNANLPITIVNPSTRDILVKLSCFIGKIDDGTTATVGNWFGFGLNVTPANAVVITTTGYILSNVPTNLTSVVSIIKIPHTTNNSVDVSQVVQSVGPTLSMSIEEVQMLIEEL